MMRPGCSSDCASNTGQSKPGASASSSAGVFGLCASFGSRVLSRGHCAVAIFVSSAITCAACAAASALESPVSVNSFAR